MPVGQRQAMLPREIISLTTYAQLDLYLEKFAAGEFGVTGQVKTDHGRAG